MCYTYCLCGECKTGKSKIRENYTREHTSREHKNIHVEQKVCQCLPPDLTTSGLTDIFTSLVVGTEDI